MKSNLSDGAMTNLGKIKLVEICNACELIIKEKFTSGHFYTYKSSCMVYSNGNTPLMGEDSPFLQEVYDLEKYKYVSTLEDENGNILTKPLGRIEINDNVDGYCIDSCHKFMK